MLVELSVMEQRYQAVLAVVHRETDRLGQSAGARIPRADLETAGHVLDELCRRLEADTEARTR